PAAAHSARRKVRSGPGGQPESGHTLPAAHHSTRSHMSNQWGFIAECLRAELADYGALLHLFEEQQRSLFNREPDTVLRLANETEAQARPVADSRCRREQAVATFAEDRGRPTTTSLRAMLSEIEVDARPLLEALITEVNMLVHRVRRTS